MSVFKHLEVNIFPSVVYELAINMRKEEATALKEYFRIEVRTLASLFGARRQR